MHYTIFMKPATIQEFYKQFPNDKACLEHLFNTRFGQNYECPKCKRKSTWYKIKAERAYCCQWCGYHLHPTAGTLFESSRTSLQLWFYAFYLFTTTRSGVSAKELQRQLGVTYKCAWRMGHEIRKHMTQMDTSGGNKLGGFGKDVEVDEGFFIKRGANEGILLGMAERGGHVRTIKISDVKTSTVHSKVVENVEKESIVHTDKAQIYWHLKDEGYIHKVANHTTGDYNGQTLDSYFGRLKLSIRGTHIWVSKKHLDKYAGEFAYRFNRRFYSEKMFSELLEVFPTRQN